MLLCNNEASSGKGNSMSLSNTLLQANNATRCCLQGFIYLLCGTSRLHAEQWRKMNDEPVVYDCPQVGASIAPVYDVCYYLPQAILPIHVQTVL